MGRVQFRFKVKELTPETTPLEDLFAVAKFVRALVLSAVSDGSVAPDPLTCVSLLRVQKGSLTSVFSLSEDVAQYVPEIVHSIHEDRIDRLPKRVAQAVKDLDDFGKQQKLTLVIPRNKKADTPEVQLGRGRVFLFPSFEEITPTNPRGETVVYGRLVRIGGENSPKAEIAVPGEGRVAVDLGMDLARRLAPRLYTTVALSGEAEWNADSLRIEHFVLKAILDYEDLPIGKAFQCLAEAAGEDWNGVDVLEYVGETRGEA